MNKILYAILGVVLLSACADTYTESYSIKGSSSVSLLDGSKLYLKVTKDSTLANFDSCDVVHGVFGFTGRYDTIKMAYLFMDDQSLMPVVIENGNISIAISKATQKASGTPLNDELYDYLDKHMQLMNRHEELSHREAQMFLDGYDEKAIYEQLAAEAAELPRLKDSLETQFIISNFDNVLGPYAFRMLTAEYQYPMLTPQIEEIMSKATPKFKGDFYVSEYYRAAREIMARMKGEISENQ